MRLSTNISQPGTYQTISICCQHIHIFSNIRHIFHLTSMLDLYINSFSSPQQRNMTSPSQYVVCESVRWHIFEGGGGGLK